MGGAGADLQRGDRALARNLIRMRRFDEAEPLYREAIAIERETRGDDHPYVAYDLQQYSAYWANVGDYAKAERYAREALRIFERQPGPPSPYIAAATSALADALCAQDKFDAATRMYERSIPLWRTTEGQNDRQTFRMKGGLGRCLVRARRFEPAERQLMEALNGLRTLYAPDHRYLVKVRKALVELYEA